MVDSIEKYEVWMRCVDILHDWRYINEGYLATWLSHTINNVSQVESFTAFYHHLAAYATICHTKMILLVDMAPGLKLLVKRYTKNHSYFINFLFTVCIINLTAIVYYLAIRWALYFNTSIVILISKSNYIK